jgi:hypothetical protein
VGSGGFVCALGVLDLRHVREAWEHTTFHPDYEVNGATTLILVGLLAMVVSGLAGLVGRLRGRAGQ